MAALKTDRALEQVGRVIPAAPLNRRARSSTCPQGRVRDPALLFRRHPGTAGSCARLFAFLFLFAFLTPAFPAPIERDLGHGLLYLRLHALPADLPAKPSGRVPPCIVDLRYLDADSPAAMAFATWLKERERAAPRSPVFVLANSDTSSALRKALVARERSAGVVVVGIPARGFQPDVAVKATAADERRAYDEFAKGATVASLLADNPEKVRNDEASLSKDPVAAASAADADDALKGKRASPPVDATLQRAVHLHRTLVALKRI